MDLTFRSDLTYEDLLEITDNFSEKNYIGPFHSGKVYRGSFREKICRNRPVIVKIWDTSSSVIRDNEMRIMREIMFVRHERVSCQLSVPKLSGCLFDGEYVAAMYDLNALDTLHRQLPKGTFHWEHRIKVALWFARLMKFFHSRNPPYEPFFIHNIDTSFILLDVDNVPKLFDFDVMTGGGIVPEKPQHGTKYHKSADERNDVYAFGLLLLSLISKKSIKKEEVKSIKSMKVTPQFGGSLLGNGGVSSFPQFGGSLLGNGVSSFPQFGGSLLGNRVSSFSLVHSTLERGPYFYGSDGEEISRLTMQCLSSSPCERLSMKQVVRRLQKLQLVQNHSDLVEIKPPSKIKPPSNIKPLS